MTFISADASITPGITTIAAAGHTPGHMAFRLESAGRSLLLTGDTANHFVASLQKPDWEVAFDMDKGAAVSTRKRMFGMLAAERFRLSDITCPIRRPAMSSRSTQGSASCRSAINF
jgi:glyoxylase-like metal-dependent hydrolase (beta-lactamase superfamily II)